MENKIKGIIIFLLMSSSCTSHTSWEYQKLEIRYNDTIEIEILDNKDYSIDSISIYDATRQYYILSRTGKGADRLNICNSIKNYLIESHIEDLKLSQKSYLYARIINLKNCKYQFFNCNFRPKNKRTVILRAEREFR